MIDKNGQNKEYKIHKLDDLFDKINNQVIIRKINIPINHPSMFLLIIMFLII